MAVSPPWTRSRPPLSSSPQTAITVTACRSTTPAISPTPTGDSSQRWSPASSRPPTAGWCGTTTSYSFLNGDAPATVHPSLWRQSQLVAKQGLYEVVDGIYQVRGLDLSNISFIEGDTGIIVIDPLVSTETAAAALALYRTHRGDRPVVAVIYTHSHVDHFGGVLGVTTQADVDAGKVAVIAPEHFTQHAVQENVYAGTAMATTGRLHVRRRRWRAGRRARWAAGWARWHPPGRWR